MDPIITLADLYAANAHWSIYAFLQGNSNAVSVDALLAERYGSAAQYTPETLQLFTNLVRQASLAADAMRRGDPVALRDIPLIAARNFPDRFGVQGVVEVVAPDLGSDDEPYESIVPFQTYTPAIPVLADVEGTIDTSVRDSDFDSSSPRVRNKKARQKSRYIRGRGRPVEYDISPFFIWRTS